MMMMMMMMVVMVVANARSTKSAYRKRDLCTVSTVPALYASWSSSSRTDASVLLLPVRDIKKNAKSVYSTAIAHYIKIDDESLKDDLYGCSPSM